MKRFFTSLMAFVLLAGGTQARKWTDIQGRVIEAEFVSQDEACVVLKLPGSVKPVPVALATLSEADREFLRAKEAEANAPVAATGKYAAQWTGSFEPGNYQGQLPFLLRVPNDLKKGGKFPLFLFLHGAGEKGNDNKKQLKHDPTKLAPKGTFENNHVIVVAPQCPSDSYWNGPLMLSVIKLVKDLQKELPVDPQRTYISGLSMGGFGTWSALALDPKIFAAAIPISGGGDPKSVHKFVKLPIWAFHCDGDPVVKAQGTRDMIAALKKAGGDPKYTEYTDALHDAWTRSYKNPELYVWLFAQKSGH
ncbi:MAG: prolyl oligopeptidase family serine peptidase [Verrucomicrobia bacterium]|nr:prolyl oligopeptidase family serine peptidase [Verrucomicrobiota bacterium]